MDCLVQTSSLEGSIYFWFSKINETWGYVMISKHQTKELHTYIIDSWTISTTAWNFLFQFHIINNIYRIEFNIIRNFMGDPISGCPSCDVEPAAEGSFLFQNGVLFDVKSCFFHIYVCLWRFLTEGFLICISLCMRLWQLLRQFT